MALEVKLDEITRSTFEADGRGIRYLQHGVAKDIAESNPAKILARIPDLPGIPKLGDEHKLYPHCLVTGYRVTGIGAFDADFFVVYETPAGFGLNFQIGKWYAFRSNSIFQDQTWLDVNNNPITVEYTPPKADKPCVVPALSRRINPQMQLILTGVFYNDVTPAEENAVDKLNNAKWYRKPAFTWQCTGCNSSPEIFGYTWRKTATFDYNPRTWDAFERYVDAHTGQSPTNITKSDVDSLVNTILVGSQSRKNGVTRARVQEAIDFEKIFGRE